MILSLSLSLKTSLHTSNDSNIYWYVLLICLQKQIKIHCIRFTLWSFGVVVNNIFKSKTKTYHLCSKPFLRKTACKPSRIKSRAPKENIHGCGTFDIVITLDTASRKCKINNRRTPIALVNCRHRVCFPSDSIEIYILVC